MKRFLALVLAALLPLTSYAQQPVVARSTVLATNFDLDGEAADDDQVVVSVQIADSTSYTIAAQPDTCRLIDVTFTDVNNSIVAGTLTITGTDCWDRPLAATWTFAGANNGVKNFTVIDFSAASPKLASGAYFKTVTAVSNGVLTGEEGAGTDLLKVGYTSNSANSWPLYGVQKATPAGRRWVDIWDSYSVNVLVKSGATATDITAVSASTTAPFQNVSAGDILVFNVAGEQITRKVVTRTDADNVIVNGNITIPAAGVNFRYRRFFFLADPIDGWIPVQGNDVVTFTFEVDANADTGGVVSSIECATFVTADPPNSDTEIQVDTATVGTGSTGEDVTTIDLRLNPQYTHCRAGIKFGTGDDADAANEDIDISIGVRK